MEYFGIGTEAIRSMLSSAWFLFTNGGWVLLVWVTLYLGFHIYMDKINGAYIGSHNRVFLHIKVNRQNLKSALSAQQIFNQLHAIHTNFTWAETYLEGKVNLWISLEIVSLGGKISYIISTPERYVPLIESAFYSQYPDIEISRVEDYMKELQVWDPIHNNWNMWGTEYKHVKDWAFPIKTFWEFEHPAAEDKILDPIAAALEALSKMEPHELFAIQYVIRPIADAEWHPHIKEVAAELKGDIVKKSKGFFGTIMKPFDAFGEKSVLDAFKGGVKIEPEHDSDFPRVMRLSDIQRDILKGVENKANNTGWEAKIRTLYIAPKDRFDTTKRAAIIGSFRQLSSGSNSLKPDVNGTWTNYNYHLSKTLEAPYVEWIINKKKFKFLKGFVNRSMWVGAKAMILNAEEIATLFHFPMATVTAPPVENIGVKKGQPPADLPIA